MQSAIVDYDHCDCEWNIVHEQQEEEEYLHGVVAADFVADDEDCWQTSKV